MRIELPDQTSVDVFAISPRTSEVDEYWPNITQCADWAEAYGASGVLLFAGNDTLIEPWVAAQSVFERTRRSSPLVAVNPIYMHPFTTAKMVASFARIYGRKTYLNMITGTALSYLHAMADELTHSERYQRLSEYGSIVQGLLTRDAPLTFEGTYYQVKNLRLNALLPAAMQPEFFLAGQSDDAIRSARQLNGVHLQMLPPNLADGLPPSARGVNFGLVTRATEAEAWAAAKKRFPEDRAGQRLLALSMNNTDSKWKQRLKRAADMTDGADSAFWMQPFANFQSDCPYLVGSYESVARRIAGLVQRGVRAIVLDLPREESEYRHANRAFAEAEMAIARDGAITSPAIA